MGDTNEDSSTREQIERRAYEIYLARGGEAGNELADWLAAEAEVTGLSQHGVPESQTGRVLSRGRRKAAAGERARHAP
ncbi:MAG: DUF2934 domain-containing protein [Candidatus Acidiferrales bacterium]